MTRYRKYKGYRRRPHNHLTHSEALEKYQSLKAEFPDALIELEEMACGHWQVLAHKSESEKDAFINRRWTDMTAGFTTI